MIIKDLNHYSRYFKGYTELRQQENRTTIAKMINGNLVKNSDTTLGGVSARVWDKGCWGFSSKCSCSQESIKEVIHTAEKNAAVLSKGVNQNKTSLPGRTSTSSVNLLSSNKRFSRTEITDFIKELDNYIESSYPGLLGRTVILYSTEIEKNCITSDGASIYSLVPRSIVRINLSIDKDGTPVNLEDSYGGLGELRSQFPEPACLHGKIDENYQHLTKKSEGIFADAGEKDCILAADLAGVLAHEAIGHTTEADYVLGGSIAGDYLNQQIASPLVSIVDFANTAFSELCPMPVYIDDEGTEAVDIPIIDNGILRNFVHSRETALLFNHSLTGNARANIYSDEPLVRMRNTVILPGQDSLEDMLASIDNGYYLMKFSNGQADSTSEFMFGITLGYEIKKGKIGRAILDTAISGVAFDVLKTVSMLSGEMCWARPGFCGKKQRIPVGMGGPAVKCKISIGGR
jgi:TldD protein